MRDVDLAHLERTIVETLLERGRVLVTVVDGDGRHPVPYPIGRASVLQFERDALVDVDVDEDRIAIMRQVARDDAGILAPRAG
ncbi:MULTISPECIES: hypothetical protein [unclassified Agrococcus]|uniref:hypothetical protein n=1 Tax=unclassified Agrococcus TaxID=2615065 RepID=UPI00360A3986